MERQGVTSESKDETWIKRHVAGYELLNVL